MTKTEKTIDFYAKDAQDFDGLTLVINVSTAENILKNTIREVLEQIEDCKFSQLGELLEKLKEEYK